MIMFQVFELLAAVNYVVVYQVLTGGMVFSTRVDEKEELSYRKAWSLFCRTASGGQ